MFAAISVSSHVALSEAHEHLTPTARNGIWPVLFPSHWGGRPHSQESMPSPTQDHSTNYPPGSTNNSPGEARGPSCTPQTSGSHQLWWHPVMTRHPHLGQQGQANISGTFVPRVGGLATLALKNIELRVEPRLPNQVLRSWISNFILFLTYNYAKPLHFDWNEKGTALTHSPCVQLTSVTGQGFLAGWQSLYEALTAPEPPPVHDLPTEIPSRPWTSSSWCYRSGQGKSSFFLNNHNQFQTC